MKHTDNPDKGFVVVAESNLELPHGDPRLLLYKEFTNPVIYETLIGMRDTAMARHPYLGYKYDLDKAEFSSGPPVDKGDHVELRLVIYAPYGNGWVTERVPRKGGTSERDRTAWYRIEQAAPDQFKLYRIYAAEPEQILEVYGSVAQAQEAVDQDMGGRLRDEDWRWSTMDGRPVD